MDSIISLGKKNTLAKYMILSGVDNRPPMLDKDLYDSWKSQMELYMQNREHERMILESVEHGPLIWPTVEDNGVIRTSKYAELSAAEKIQADCDMKATNIILQGLHADIYSLVNHHRVAKDLWERVQLLMQGFVVPVFSPGDDPIACLNKAMAFLTVIASSRFISINNQLRTSSNPRKQATIQDGRVTVQQVQGRQGQNYSGTTYKDNATSSRGNTTSGHARVVKCYNCQGEGHMAKQCTQPKRPRNVAWYKEKVMLAEAQKAGQILDEEQLAFLVDLGIPAAVLMANISNYGSGIILEVPNSETYRNDMDNQSMHALQDFEQRLNIDLSSREKMIDSQMDDMIREKLALKEQVDSLDQNLSKQIKEKESVLQTFIVFKNKSKEKENKYMENEINIKKKIKELDNIIYKVGQYAQTVHMLTKQQAFYDITHKQALGYQNPFYLKKAQRIKPTLYDGVVMSNPHVVMPVINDKETLILEEESR
ncbi:integrase, catalytic region, zinc finger, CCHC-type containing protein [Tanacetum coccineum]